MHTSRLAQQQQRQQHARALVLSSGGEAPSSAPFESAYADTYGTGASGDILKTLAQFNSLLSILAAPASDNSLSSNRSVLAFIPELHSAAVQGVMTQVLAVVSLQGLEGIDAKLTEALRAIESQLQQVSAKFGYPVVRRIVLGALLKRRLEHGKAFPAEVQQAIDGVLHQLFQMHKQSSAEKGIVQFLHISKSGGTNLCATAGVNNCTSEGFDERHNCLVKEFHDIPRWVTYNAHKYVQYRITTRQATPWFVNFHSFRQAYDCQARVRVLRENGWNFYANEFSNPPSQSGVSTQLICKEFVNLLLFRNPYDRLKSQISWIQKLYKEFYVEVDTKRAFQNRTAGFWERLMPAGVNNYYIRSMLGQRYFEYPIVHIQQHHVMMAKLAALQYDLLLNLENKEGNDISVRVGLGWQHSLQEAQMRSSTGMREEVCLPVDYEHLLQHNAPDMELYAFVKELHSMDVLLWNFVTASDKLKGTNSLITDNCGYVSLVHKPTPRPNATLAVSNRQDA